MPDIRTRNMHEKHVVSSGIADVLNRMMMLASSQANGTAICGRGICGAVEQEQWSNGGRGSELGRDKHDKSLCMCAVANVREVDSNRPNVLSLVSVWGQAVQCLEARAMVSKAQ
jgi:hypothetical protein